MKKRWYVAGLSLCFLVGAYTWKIAYTGRHATRYDEDADYSARIPMNATLVYIGEDPVTSEDLEWEFTLHTKGLNASEQLTPNPIEGPKLDKSLSPLKEELLRGIIERKLLYQFVSQDGEFDLTNPARFTSCLQEWQNSVAEAKELLQTKEDRERLKSRLCEQSILTQYLDERIYPKVQITDEEIQNYFEENKNEFRKPSQVVVRQVVLSTEDEAKKVYAKIKNASFEQYAREYSITPEAENGGLVGPFAQGQLPPFFDVAFSMQVGEITGIIKSHYGFHIIKLEKKIPKVALGFTEAQPKIREKLVQKKKEEEFKKWVEVALNAIPVRTPKPLW